MKCPICGAKMVRDEIKSFTYIIPYVCSRCGSRHSTLKKKYREKWNSSKEAPS